LEIVVTLRSNESEVTRMLARAAIATFLVLLGTAACQSKPTIRAYSWCLFSTKSRLA
jgi:hypothetical protein